MSFALLFIVRRSRCRRTESVLNHNISYTQEACVITIEKKGIYLYRTGHQKFGLLQSTLSFFPYLSNERSIVRRLQYGRGFILTSRRARKKILQYWREIEARNEILFELGARAEGDKKNDNDDLTMLQYQFPSLLGNTSLELSSASLLPAASFLLRLLIGARIARHKSRKSCIVSTCDPRRTR
jgi:hypothetical protein